MLISLWFDSKNHKEPWYGLDIAPSYMYIKFTNLYRYIGRRISEAESRLLGVKPPDVVTRIPRYFRGRGWKGISACAVNLPCWLSIF